MDPIYFCVYEQVLDERIYISRNTLLLVKECVIDDVLDLYKKYVATYNGTGRNINYIIFMRPVSPPKAMPIEYLDTVKVEAL